MSSSNSPCAACKFLRRKCTQECVFAPYFPADNPQRFSCVHRVFGASNVSKLLNELSASQREDAVKSLAYEAEARLRDPVYGCIGFIAVLQQKLRQIQTEVHNAKKELSTYLSPQAMQALQTMFANPAMMEAMLANPTMIPSMGMVSHQSNTGFPPYGNTNMAGAPPLLVAAPHNQLVIRDAQQQELLEAQQLAAVQQQRELMLKSYEQQQQEFLRFGGFDTVVVGGGSGGGGLNQMGGAGGDGGGQPRLALGNFDNVGLHQIQQQHQPQEEQQHHLHAHDVLHAHPHPLEAQQLLSPQQTFSQQQPPPQQQPQSEGGDRWSLNPSS